MLLYYYKQCQLVVFFQKSFKWLYFLFSLALNYALLGTKLVNNPRVVLFSSTWLLTWPAFIS